MIEGNLFLFLSFFDIFFLKYNKKKIIIRIKGKENLLPADFR